MNLIILIRFIDLNINSFNNGENNQSFLYLRIEGTVSFLLIGALLTAFL